jgi:hypothetical protein
MHVVTRCAVHFFSVRKAYEMKALFVAFASLLALLTLLAALGGSITPGQEAFVQGGDEVDLMSPQPMKSGDDTGIPAVPPSQFTGEVAAPLQQAEAQAQADAASVAMPVESAAPMAMPATSAGAGIEGFEALDEGDFASF